MPDTPVPVADDDLAVCATVPTREPDLAPPAGGAPADRLVVEDLLVEDVSIDGMCGVY